MKSRKQDFLLGLTAILFLALLVGTVIFLAPSFEGPTRIVHVYFPHELGMAPLKEGSQVLLSGAVQVGSVAKVEPRELKLDSNPRTPPQTVIFVEAEVSADIPLYGNCEITTDMPLVGGSGTLVISNVGTPGVPLPPGPIEGRPPQGMAALSNVSRQLVGEHGLLARVDRLLDPDVEGSLANHLLLSLADVNAITGELRTQLSVAEQQTLLAKIHRIMDGLSATTTAVREELEAGRGGNTLGKLHTALDLIQASLGEAQLLLSQARPSVARTLTSVEHAATVIDEQVIVPLGREFDRQAPTALLAEVHEAMAHLNASLENVEAATERGERLIALTRPELELILANAREMSETLAQTSRDIQRNPAKLLRGPTATEEEKLGVLTAAHDFAQAATELNQATSRLEAILPLVPEQGTGAVNDEDLRNMLQTMRRAFARFERAEQFFWEEIK